MSTTWIRRKRCLYQRDAANDLSSNQNLSPEKFLISAALVECRYASSSDIACSTNLSMYAEDTDIGTLRVSVGVDHIHVCDDTRRLEDVHIVQVYSYGQDVQVLVFVGLSCSVLTRLRP